jgi:hypothetical protein
VRRDEITDSVDRLDITESALIEELPPRCR